MAYYRKGPKTLLIIGNFQKDAKEVTLPRTPKTVLINNCQEVSFDGARIHLKGWQFLVMEI
jgi:oligo-1,6-glucosidase